MIETNILESEQLHASNIDNLLLHRLDNSELNIKNYATMVILFVLYIIPVGQNHLVALGESKVCQQSKPVSIPVIQVVVQKLVNPHYLSCTGIVLGSRKWTVADADPVDKGDDEKLHLISKMI